MEVSGGGVLLDRLITKSENYSLQDDIVPFFSFILFVSVLSLLNR